MIRSIVSTAMWCALLCAIPSFMVFAQDIDAAQSEIQQIHREVQETEGKRSLARLKMRKAAQEVKDLQRDVSTRAKRIKTSERQLVKLQRELDTLFREEAKKSEALYERREEVGQLISAGWSLQHRPQLAAWVRPDDARERALTSRAMHMTTVALKKQMDTLDQSIQALEGLRESIVRKQERNKEMQTTLHKERKELQKVLDKQQRLVKSLRKEERQYTDRINQLTEKSKSLKELVEALEDERKKQQSKFSYIYPILKPADRPKNQTSPTMTTAKKPQTIVKSTNFVKLKGKLSLPVEGEIIGRYGEKRGYNDHLKGLEMKAIADAVVSTPFKGEVLFTGPFLDYGNMVIIRHSREYHTLVAGLSRINVSVGQFLLDDAPIGVMGGTNRTLYLELRKNSQAINPEKWFAIEKKQYATR